MSHVIKEHSCFDKLVEETESNATFEKTLGFNFETGKTYSQWVINLYRYTPSLLISSKRGFFIPSFCPMCGFDFRDTDDNKP